jgi:hypothetical protein
LFASLANPYGYKLYVHIFRYLGDPFLMDHIDEFLSPNFHGLAQKCFAILLLLTILGAAVARKRLRTSQLLVVCFAIYTGLYASRNIPISCLLLILIMGPMISEAIIEWSGHGTNFAAVRRTLVRLRHFGQRVSATESRVRGHAWPVIAVLLGVWICLHQGRFAKQTLMDARFDEKRLPVQAADFLSYSNLHEPVFSPDSWGGYLIYRLYPQTRVVVDDRHDLYGPEFLKNYLKIVRGEEQWSQALDNLHANWVLFPKSSPLASLLREAPLWKVVYQDDTAILFERASAESQ